MTPEAKVEKLQKRVLVLAEGLADALVERSQALSIAGRAVALLDEQDLGDAAEEELRQLKHDVIALVG